MNETSNEGREANEQNVLNDSNQPTHLARRSFLKLGAVGAAAVAVGTTSTLIVPQLRRKGL